MALIALEFRWPPFHDSFHGTVADRRWPLQEQARASALTAPGSGQCTLLPDAWSLDGIMLGQHLVHERQVAGNLAYYPRSSRLACSLLRRLMWRCLTSSH